VESASQQVGIEFISLSKMHFDERVLALLPQVMMVQHRSSGRLRDNRLTLAMVNPTTSLRSTTSAASSGRDDRARRTTEEDFRKFMNTT